MQMDTSKDRRFSDLAALMQGGLMHLESDFLSNKKNEVCSP